MFEGKIMKKKNLHLVEIVKVKNKKQKELKIELRTDVTKRDHTYLFNDRKMLYECEKNKKVIVEEFVAVQECDATEVELKLKSREHKINIEEHEH